jgi:hypothetical protein
MLQDMQSELERESYVDKETFDKAMCTCDEMMKDTQNKIADATAESSQQSSAVDSGVAEQSQLNQEISDHQASKEAAEHDLSEATNIRNKQKAEFLKEEKETKISIRQLSSAIPALEKGLTGASLLQFRWGPRLRRLVEVTHYLSAEERTGVLAFLDSGTDDEDSVGDTQQAPSSSEVVGMLKNMKDEMVKNLAEMREQEKADGSSFGEMAAAKNQEMSVAEKAIIAKDQRLGALALAVAEAKHALEDAGEELADANKFLSDTKEDCEAKKKDRDIRAKMRTEEIAAISDAVKMLNDDDAMMGFSKLKGAVFAQRFRLTPKPVQTYDAFLQIDSTRNVETVAQRGVAFLAVAQRVRHEHKHKAEAAQPDDSQSPAKAVVTTLVNGMVAVLHDEDIGDEHKKEWCANETAINGNLLQEKEQMINKLSSTISDQEDQSATLAEQIKDLQDQINTLDKMVYDKTQLRKKEHQEFVDTFATMSTSTRLIKKAVSRLERFYSPKKSASDRKAAADAAFKREGLALLRKRDQQTSDAAVLQQEAKLMPGGFDSFLQVSSRSQSKQYVKKEGGGVIGLLMEFMGDIKADMAEAETEEKYNAKEYSRIMGEAQSTRNSNLKAMNQKTSAKADLDEKLVSSKSMKEQSVEEQHNLEMFMAQLAGECSFLLRNFEVRHEGRIEEEVGLESAKTIVTHEEPPSHSDIEDQYDDEKSEADVDEHFPDAQVTQPSPVPDAQVTQPSEP